MAKPPKLLEKPPGTRKHLTKTEVERLRIAVRSLGRHPHRDDTMILLAYRHGLRAAEVVGYHWDQIDWEQKTLHVWRVKKGSPAAHPLRREVLAALRKLGVQESGPIFRSERGAALSTRTFAHIVKRAGAKAGLGFSVHAHMLRHGCGYYLASQGHDTRAIQAWLGHRNIQHTVLYTEMAPDRFRDFWAEGMRVEE